MLITAIIDVIENQDVAVIDAPGALLASDVDEEVVVISENDILGAMLEIDNEIYKKCVIFGKNGKKHLYVRLSKAMCGTLKAELLCYRKLSRELKEYGFVINPYDPCVANKCTNKGKLTVVWHVDNMKVLHKSKKEVTKSIDYIKVIYGDNMPVIRGKKHNYVGTDIYYSTPGEIIVSMDSCITEMMDKFQEEIMQRIKPPIGNHLFRVDNACTKICEIKKIMFHQLVVKLLFLSKHTRPYIQLTIAFLITRLQNLNKDDWKKLLRVLSHLGATINGVKLHLNANYLKVVYWWVDES